MPTRTASAFLGIAATLAVTGCMSMSGQGTLEAVQEAVTGKGEAHVYTEAYVEFAGPGARWSGPVTLLLHVSAKDPSVPAAVSVTPEMFAPAPALEVAPAGRAPASEGAAAPAAAAPALTSELAREQLAYLATALQGEEPVFQGCLYPVRVRLVRQDGALLDKQGCRGITPWVRSASQAVDFFLARR